MQSPARDPEIPRLHADYVRALARSLVFDDALADDVAQDVWVAALEHGPRDQGSLRAWLAAIVRNLAIKSWRGDRRRAAREIAAARPESVPSAEEILERESVRRRVIEAVLALDEPYRSTIVLRYFEGLAPREVARRLRLPVETVRTREKRAREILRARLDREHGSDRRAWSLALVRELRIGAPGHGWPIVAESFLSGGLLMSTVKLVAGGAAALLVLLGTLAWLDARHRTEDRSGNGAGAAGDLTPILAAADRTSAKSERVELPAEEPATAKVAEKLGSLLVRVRWGDDHTPAADVGVQVEDEIGKVEFRWIDARTGPDGTCTIEHLRPGKVSVNSDRPLVGLKLKELATAEIKPDHITELEIEIAPGITVDGEVVDENGDPEAGAFVLLAFDQIGWTGLPVARAGADGTFHIRAASPGACLCAYLAGRSPSLRPRLSGSVGSEVHIRLVLPGTGGELEGVVTDAGGAPVPDAKVLVGFEDYHDVRFVEGQAVHGPASRLASTDEQGLFRVEGLAPGLAPISVRAPRFAQRKGTVEIHANETTRTDVRLSEQVIVEGSVHDVEGRPLAGALVGLEGPEPFLWVRQKTSEDGSYRLVGLPVGDFHLKALMRETGSAEVDLHGEAGAVLRWDAVLSSARSITGRIVGPIDDFAGFVVEGRPTKLGRGVLGRVGADGKFKMTDLEDGPYDLVVYESKHLPLARMLGVSPGATDLQIQIDRANLPSARICGRLVGPEGKPVDAEIHLSIQDKPRLRSSVTIHSDLSTGRFEAGPLPPGDWDLTIDAKDFVRKTVPRRSLAADETWDLGDVQISRGGVLVVISRLENGSELPSMPNESPRFEIASTGEPLTTVGGEARSGLLLPGRDMLRIDGSLDPPIACTSVPFEITVGQETRLDLVLHAGRHVTLAVPVPSPAPAEVWFAVATKDGTNLTMRLVRDARGGRFESELRLLDGEYRAEATTKDGRRFGGTLTIAEGGPEVFELELKSP